MSDHEQFEAFLEWAQAASNQGWKNDLVQFSRLLCEIAATQDVDFDALSKSTDLERERINELFERAHNTWEGIKKWGIPSCRQIGPDLIAVEEDLFTHLTTRHSYDVAVKATAHELLVHVHKYGHEEPIVVVDKPVQELAP